MSSDFIFTHHHSRTACPETLVPTQPTKQLSKEPKALPASPIPEGHSGSQISSVHADFRFTSEEMQMSSLSSDEFPQKEEKPDLPTTSSLSAVTAARPWINIRQHHPYATDSPPKKQISIANASCLGTTKTIEGKSQCMDLGISINKGKNPISEYGEAA